MAVFGMGFLGHAYGCMVFVKWAKALTRID